MALYDADDQLVASARGRPPEWLSGIHGAELWPLLQGTTIGPIDFELLTDCKAVLSSLDGVLAAEKEALGGMSWNVLKCSQLRIQRAQFGNRNWPFPWINKLRMNFREI